MDHYEILQLSPAATFEAIECMFRHQAKRYHPDAGATGCQEKFKRLVDAYNALKHPEKRAAYDVTYERNLCDQKVVERRGRIYDRRLRGASQIVVSILCTTS
ncbi:MAG: J domain-containing protein [Microbacteriaceae bacterium]|nr:J domain-containing protein [Microbacteriaceae bacterium]